MSTEDREEAAIREIVRRWNAGEWEVDPTLIDPEVEVHSALTSSVNKLVRMEAFIGQDAAEAAAGRIGREGRDT